MDQLIVYNTPFPCLSKCEGCYYMRALDQSKLDLKAGSTILNQHLTRDKRTTLVLAVINHPMAWSHAEYILKRTRHLRKYRQTRLLVNAAGLRYSDLINLLEREPVDEVSISSRFATAKKASQIGIMLRQQTENLQITTIYTYDREAVGEITSAVSLLRVFDTIFITPVIDAEEAEKLVRTQPHLEELQELVKNVPQVSLTSCLGCFQTPQCHVSYDSYIEITGSHTLRGCAYGVYNICKGKRNGEQI